MEVPAVDLSRNFPNDVSMPSRISGSLTVYGNHKQKQLCLAEF
ncbi:hypothetical protein SLEP1_g983 [Rubroshorea leprosula]|uniref:Uncharacterized protein n=1 Tax=Rubroshorea leprosula TaxID=152421 RepID=A0AAV5HCD9_9ROSI|nr:hypothetical protein SLEP1_g983 [Rubroshorea leprosula]